MNLFILDDNQARHDYFESVFGKAHNIVRAYSFYEAVGLLWAHSRFDVVFLDHDLGLPIPTTPQDAPGWEMSGQDVARWMAASLHADRLPPKRPNRVVIHSANEAGKRGMAATLRDAGFSDIVLIDFLQIGELSEKLLTFEGA